MKRKKQTEEKSKKVFEKVYCKQCGYLRETENCPLCKSTEKTLKYKSVIMVCDPKKSTLAQKAELKHAGIFAMQRK